MLETILSDLVAQNQLLSSDLEVPLGKLERFLIRFENINLPDHCGVMKAVYIETIADCVDLSLNFDQNVPIVTFLAKLYAQGKRNDVPKIDEDFAAWCQITKHDKSTRQYCQALIAEALQNQFGEDVSGQL